LAPYFVGDGMEEEQFRAYCHWVRMVVNPNYMEVSCVENIERRSNLSVEEFFKDYESPGKPVIITDKMVDWPAMKKWNRQKLLEKFQNVKFRTGSGYKMKFKKYIKYLDRNSDMYPLYLFDQNYPDNTDMEGDYKILPYWDEDLFKIVGEEERPPYRWVLVGAPRTGVPFHTDPRATGAWNGLISGKKRWILFAPEHRPIGVGDDTKSDYYESPEAIKWFLDFYPKCNKSQAIECVQRPGEIIFIPSGWWHCTFNIVESYAITQNFASTRFFERVANDLVNDRDSFYRLFESHLEKEGRKDLIKMIEEKKNQTTNK